MENNIEETTEEVTEEVETPVEEIEVEAEYFRSNINLMFIINFS